MNSSYLQTYDGNNDLIVEVFPSARRSNVQLSARDMTEWSFSNFISTLIDYDGFIITSSADWGTSNPFEFNIHGYYFKVAVAQNILDLGSGWTDIWANIVIDETNPDYPELWGQDDSGSHEYQGIAFTDEKKTSDPNGTVYSLKLFEKIGSDWKVVESSRLKLNTNSIVHITSIDGGENTLT